MEKENLIQILQEIQEEHGWLPPEILNELAEKSGIKLAKIMSVASFYAQFKTSPAGKYQILLCQGTACHVNGSKIIEEVIKEHLGVKEDETTADGLFSYKNVACLGCCGLSPAMMISGKTYGKLTKEATVEILKNIAATEVKS